MITTPASGTLLSELGHQHLGQRLAPSEVQDVTQHFAGCSPLPGYIPGRFTEAERASAYTLDGCRKRGPFACYRLEDVLAAPHLLDAAMAPDVLEAARYVLGVPPVIYSVNVFWTFPGGAQAGTQVFHRDFDDDKFVGMFFYLTDFTIQNGSAQRYVTGSHDSARFSAMCKTLGKMPYSHYWDRNKDAGVHASLERDFPVVSLVGTAGTAVLMLPSGFHCGGKPRENRCIAWVRYGAGPNKVYTNDGMYPVAVPGREPSDLTRLILK